MDTDPNNLTISLVKYFPGFQVLNPLISIRREALVTRQVLAMVKKLVPLFPVTGNGLKTWQIREFALRQTRASHYR